MRIISKLDVKPPFVVKPVHFEGLRKVGTPADLAAKYYSQGADEIFYIDIVASLYQREILLDEISAFSEGVFVPLGVGGGVRSIDDMSQLFHSGADKIVLNTHALQTDPGLIDRAAKMFGAQSIVINIEAKSLNGDWVCYSDCGRIPSSRTVSSWVDEVINRGAGEILIQSVDRDGRQKGYDLDLIKNVVDRSPIPVVASSGAGSKEDVLELVKATGVSAIAISSVLHYELETIDSIRAYLKDHGIEGV
ncbi:imidazole glycerol phosphate synthase subunit HisF [Aliamphritea hakodatensis]|uniref:imidazole glycerol phosphate synthase subunit HisF n=1 Tax=Aliamphritea hakodatensis TaxID=2895352 RepID=UPI0022FD55B3|nr:imidazole glycerol phosphate synthase cyclase subunit [Aliamphritea hakodatensis]